MKSLLPIVPLLWSACFSFALANAVRPVVEIEEDVYTYQSANNGAGPMWCAGSTCLVRIGEEVFASGLETLQDAKPLNNCRWMLFKRGPSGWEKIRVDDTGRSREPSPMAAFADGRLFLSANPTLASPSQEGGGPARPEIVVFSAKNPKAPAETLLPAWDGKPRFTEHSYRSFAADASNRELILFQNIDYTHAEWAFLDREGRWSAQGQLKWPWGADYDKPQPIRVCYANVALKNRAVYFCGVSDIVEPNLKWREFKKQITGRDWDYDFRRLFFTWTPDITREKFRDWIEIASRDQTAGWLFPADLWVASDGAVHLLWTERALDERLREKFLPAARQSYALNHAVVRDGKIASRRALLRTGDGGPREIPSAARFQVTPENRLFVFYYVHGQDATGKPISENRLVELEPNGMPGPAWKVPLKAPFTSFFTATPRAGSPPSNTLELLGQQAGKLQTISYARIRIGM
ncbi:MAG: hypothetical protein HYY23_20610 [Verrucomicrobia bacterium]|nr:hypothetical protein [Verrucomicrobiota bacterium]